MATAREFGVALIHEFQRRVFEESLPRLRSCLSELSESDVWQRPNEHSNCAGNLILHLCGNARQYVVSGLGGGADSRERAAEFAERGPIPKAQLLELLESTMADMKGVIQRTDPERLLEIHRVQGFEESGLSILVHVAEHFSYHTGQIAYFVKWVKNIDTGFYAGIDLNRKSR